MFQERDQGRRNAHNLARRNVHVIDAIWRLKHKLFAVARRHPLIQEAALGIQRRIRLRDNVAILHIRRHVFHFVADEGDDLEVLRGQRTEALRQLGRHVRAGRRDLFIRRRIDHVLLQRLTDQFRIGIRQRLNQLAIRRLDEAVGVDPPVGRQPADQTDVRAFRRLDRADAPIVRMMHVAHIETGALAAQTARAQGRQRALVTQLGQWIRLIHELRQLR